MNSVDLYSAACNFTHTSSSLLPEEFYYFKKNFYLQIVTTMFHELLTTKTSPLLSKFCADNKVNFIPQNFKIERVAPNNSFPSSLDMLMTLDGLNAAFSKNLDACATMYDEQDLRNFLFQGQLLPSEYFTNVYANLQNIDTSLKKFQPVEKVVEKILEKPVEKIVEAPKPKTSADENATDLFKALDETAQNRKADDERIVDEIKKVQLTLQNELATVQQSLKEISAIRDEIDFRGMKEPIYQLIQLYHKIDDNVKRHPMTDTAKGYTSLIKRCESFLRYVTQSLKMLGVELIDETGGTFNPDTNKVAEDETASLDAAVTKILKVGFIYKGQILEKAEVELAKPTPNQKPASTSRFGISNFFGGKN